jgi:hypothetical protein
VQNDRKRRAVAQRNRKAGPLLGRESNRNGPLYIVAGAMARRGVQLVEAEVCRASATKGMGQLLERNAEKPTPRCPLYGRSVARFAAFDNADRIAGSPVGLVQLARLRVGEGHPIAHGFAIGQRRASYALPPFTGEQR